MRGRFSVGKEVHSPSLNLAALFSIVLLLLAGCSYNGPSNNAATPGGNTTTGLKKRVLISNQQTGTVFIVDAQRDQMSNAVLTAPGGSKMITTGGFTAVLESGTNNTVNFINDSTEVAVPQIALPASVEDIALKADGSVAYAAVRDAGVVNAVAQTGGSNIPVTVPTARRLAISPNGTKLLAFADDPQTLATPNAFFVIDTATLAVAMIAPPANAPGILDQPFTAVFNNSETQAFILNCGPECGGKSASVTLVDFSGPTPNFIGSTPVAGATVGLLNGSTLFVAGSPPGAPNAMGALETINANTLGLSSSIFIPTDGLHLKMQLAGNNRLYIGSQTCTPGPGTSSQMVQGCLTIFNTGTGASVRPQVSSARINFDVTGIQPISHRNVVYVCQGGGIDILDTTTDALAATQLQPSPQGTQVPIGKLFDVVQIDP